MQVGSFIAMRDSGTLNFLRDLPAKDGKLRYRIGKVLDAAEKELEAIAKESRQVLEEVAPGAKEIAPPDPRFDAFKERMQSFLDAESDVVFKPIFGPGYFDGTNITTGQERLLQEVGLLEIQEYDVGEPE